MLVIGCGGSGKSTLARQLAPKLGLPLVHLDTGRRAGCSHRPRSGRIGCVDCAPPTHGSWTGVLAQLARFEGEVVVLNSRRAVRRYLQAAK